jgi:hypothetical protein
LSTLPSWEVGRDGMVICVIATMQKCNAKMQFCLSSPNRALAGFYFITHQLNHHQQ